MRQHASTREELAQIQETYADMRSKAVQDLSQALAYGSQCAKLWMPKPDKLNLQASSISSSAQKERTAAARAKALSAIKVSGKVSRGHDCHTSEDIYSIFLLGLQRSVEQFS